MYRGLCQTISRKAEKRSTAPYIAICGAQGVGKTTLAEALKPKLAAVLKKDVHIAPSVGRRLKDRGFPIDNQATVEAKWAFEAVYMDLETELRHVPKIFCRSVVDRYAYARANDLDMESYFNKMLPTSVAEYDAFFYIPIEDTVPLVADGVRNSDEEYRRKVDTCIRRVIFDWKIEPQVLMGTVNQRATIALESIKLLLGL